MDAAGTKQQRQGVNDSRDGKTTATMGERQRREVAAG